MLLGLIMLLAVGVSAKDTSWEMTEIGGVKYVSLNRMWKFYRLSTKTGRAGCISYGDNHHVVSVRPEKQDFYVNNYRYILSYPIRRHHDKLFISAIDVKKLVDPVLRPNRLKTRNSVKTVVIDPGHGGHDAGATSPWAREADCNLSVGLKLKAKLERAGYRVVMTRSTDVFLTLGQRVAIANRTPDSIFVSIHHNSGRRAASGIETFTLAPQGTTSPFARTRLNDELQGNEQDSENIALATAVHSRAIKSTKAIDRGIQRARFSVLCTITRPAILFEGGFVSNPDEGRLISTNSYQTKLADSIYEGIVAYIQTVGNGNGLKARNTRTMGSGSMQGGGSIHGGSSYRGTTRL